MPYKDRFVLSREQFSDAAHKELARLRREDPVLAGLKFEMWLDRFYDNGDEVVMKLRLRPVKWPVEEL